MAVAVALHILAAIVWVGGMFFAVLALRPSAGTLDPPARLLLWQGVLRRFFAWVWATVAVLLGTGYWMIFVGYGGFANLPVYLHIMQGLGVVMVLIFLHLWFAPYARFRRAVSDGAFPDAGAALNQIRWIVTTNLALGLLNAAIGASGRYWLG